MWFDIIKTQSIEEHIDDLINDLERAILAVKDI